MSKFRKKPIVIEAELYRPGLEDRWVWLSGDGGHRLYPTEAEAKEAAGCLVANIRPCILTLEGFLQIRTDPPDWIITGIQGERYPCKPDIFEATYEKVPE